jgi:hypothetical protein
MIVAAPIDVPAAPAAMVNIRRLEISWGPVMEVLLRSEIGFCAM